MGGPIAERAEITDKNPPQLVKYDRWGHDVSEVIIAETAKATKRDLVESGFMGPKFREKREARRRPDGPAWHGVWLPAEPGRDRHVLRDGRRRRHGRGAGRRSSRRRTSRSYVLSRIASGEWVGATGQFFTERTGGSDLGGLETTATPNGDVLAAERLQVVRLQLRRRGVRRPREADRRARRRQGQHPVPRPQAEARRQPQRHPHPPAQGRSWARTRSLPARWSSLTRRRSCSPAPSTRRRLARATAAAWRA